MTVTHYEYDGDRLVRSVSVSEPVWSPEDVALLVASKQYERSLDENGVPISESTDPVNQFRFKGPEKPLTNWATKTRDDLRDAYYKKYDTKDAPVNRNGHLWTVTRR